MIDGRLNPPRNGEVAACSADGGAEHRRRRHRTVGAPIETVHLARRLRRDMSLPDVLLWNELRGQPQGLKFRRQHPVRGFIADFACLDRRLLIEVDGIAHAMGDRPSRDEIRNGVLGELARTVLRVTAADVLKDPATVAATVIALAVSLRPLRPCGAPPRSGEDLEERS